MANRTQVEAAPKQKDTTAVTSRDKSRHSNRPPTDGFRETVESVVIAFALAFLFRGFEAEAFVIPTGSMAPTLMGRHKDLVCESCQYPYRVSASEEVDSRTGRLVNAKVEWSTCPMCRHTMRLDTKPDSDEPYYSYNGDRIIASKMAYQLGDPARWDVVVFKCPEEAQTNFIKRLVGLPNETLRIWHGDLYVRPDGADEFAIQQKPDGTLWDMLQIVHDSDYACAELSVAGWPLRWQSPSTGGAAGFEAAADGRSFHSSGSASEEWLIYQHIVPPAWDDTQELAALSQSPALMRPQLITDFTEYNTSRCQNDQTSTPSLASLGLHWVGDLLLECDIETESNAGTAILALIEGGREFRCEFDLATGRATLLISGLTSFHPVAETAVKGPGRHHVALANVDNELSLWVDGEAVEFDRPTTYPALDNNQPTDDDLAPGRIGSRGAKLEVSHLRLWRDVYYISARAGDDRERDPISDFRKHSHPELFLDGTEANWLDLLTNPDRWESFAELDPIEFKLGADEFFFLGDNSPRSRDSRLWDGGYAVERDLLLGKALLVYWPHAWEAPFHGTLPVFGRELRFPFYPNFRRMGAIR